MFCHSLSEFVIIFVVTSCGMQYASVCSNSGVRINHAPAASVAPTLHKGKAVATNTGWLVGWLGFNGTFNTE